MVAGSQLQEAVGVGGGEPRGTHGRKPGPEEGPGNGRSEGPGMSGVGWHHAALLTYSTSLGQGWPRWGGPPGRHHHVRRNKAGGKISGLRELQGGGER